jgi:hypothetical protein
MHVTLTQGITIHTCNMIIRTSGTPQAIESQELIEAF